MQGTRSLFPSFSSSALRGGWPATRKVRARVHACLDAVQRAVRCMCTRRDVQPLQRCTADATCGSVHRCTGVREPLRAIIMAAVDTPSLSPVSNASSRLVRTYARSSARSPSLYFPRRERTRAREANAPRNTRTHASKTRLIIHAAYSISRTRQCSMGESGGHSPGRISFPRVY